MTFTFRRAVPTDAAAIQGVRLESIRTLGPLVYTPEQVEGWAVGKTIEAYADQIGQGHVITTVAVEGEKMLGWGDYHFDAKTGTHRIGVYVRGSAARQGVGRAVFQAAELLARAAGAQEIRNAASLAAVPFYTVMGMEIVEEGTSTLRNGVALPCVYMRKVLL